MAAQDRAYTSAVLYKLVLFAILMAVVPIGTYFATLTYAWGGMLKHQSGNLDTALTPGKTTPSAICAVFAANVVLVGYVVVAFREEAAEARAGQTTSNAPRARKDQ